MLTAAIGIHDLSFSTGQFVLPHAESARHNGTDVDKYHVGLGQVAMSVPAIDEDIVTMGAAAAAPILERHGHDRIRTILFATETSVDQSKAAGVFVHRLLGLPESTRVVELKQACYSGTAALQLAVALVQRDRRQQVLVIAGDVSKYPLDSPGEPTQGAAAVAMLVAADPALVRVVEPSGLFTNDVMDFWRPNYRSTAIVDGRLSVDAYLQAVEGTWKDYTERGGLSLNEIAAVCYHQPFTTMAHKAHRHLLSYCGQPSDRRNSAEAVGRTTAYNAVIGNSYTASMYLGLASLLDSTDDIMDQTVGFLSYGSGSVAEFFTGVVAADYRDHRRRNENRDVISRRTEIDYAAYRELHEYDLPVSGEERALPRQTAGSFRLAGIADHKRVYQPR
ncbi:hydroxymethylglutaryl-CoA synthase [Amycolatopsis azurea]|uniref:Hydroxymethylglutaryl-CoA synthase n=1 Tax=Amycolatopsis azurea DSM 43854 TaxID=1238180 RepID=M2NNC2_9PSEU|nr:hydroxymethylglutaryl-CoA synthase [Amycolatopsis azurea]EMD23679.1 Hydroxymethylglutaryl-CoA synthase [Amycolatopsis azurea DSM 43854]OOC02990.1 hydroxymethylglutaryl-CoA synthase [Amycolatopsis azurea DSM 43854]